LTAEIAVAAAVGVAVAALVASELRARRARAAVCKTAASVGFVLLAVLRADLSRPYDRWLVIALVLSLVGDVLLALPHALPAGLAAFLLAHLAFIAAFSALTQLGAWPRPVLAGLAVASLIAAAWLWPHVGRLRPAVLAYVAVITVMAWGAIAAAGRTGRISGAAGILFYLSDLAVARDRFVVRRFASRAWGLPAYYAAQVMFALTLGGPKA